MTRLHQALGRFVFGLGLCGLSAGHVWSACDLSIEGDFGAVQFSVDLADTEQERSKGLMFVSDLPLFSGMLFIYEQPSPVSFWMKNTLIPLDMIFFDVAGRVVKIHNDAIPHDETPIFGGTDIRAVLEVNAGMVERLGLQVGDRISKDIYNEKNFFSCDD